VAEQWLFGFDTIIRIAWQNAMAYLGTLFMEAPPPIS